MLIYFLALLAAAVALFGLQPGREANRWAAFFLFFASLGGLAGSIRDTRLAVPLPPGGFDPVNTLLSTTISWLEFANHTLTPYGVLLFAIVYTGRFERRTRRLLKLLLLLPAAGTAIGMLLSEDGLRLSFPVLLAWAGPYYATACWLLISGAVRERNPGRKREKAAVAILVVPTLLAIVAFINIAMVFAPGFPFFRYVAGFIAYSLLAGTAFAFGSGVLGVKVRVERDPLERAVKAVGSGTAMLNHTIKNEIAKISMCTDTLRASLGDHERAAAEQLELIARSAEHMSRMVTRIHGQTRDIRLVLRPERLTVIADACLKQFAAELAQRGIDVVRAYEDDPVVQCDSVHMQEVLSNLVRNAMEAMPEGGMLSVRIRLAKRFAELSIQDSGAGIAKEMLGHVLEPFYTTKARSGNFGLGLTYCYNVMHGSGGAIALDSEQGKGTVVTLSFPRANRKEAAP